MIKHKPIPEISWQHGKYIQPSLGIEIAKYFYFWGFRLTIHIYKLRVTLSTHKSVKLND